MNQLKLMCWKIYSKFSKLDITKAKTKGWIWSFKCLDSFGRQGDSFQSCQPHQSSHIGLLLAWPSSRYISPPSSTGIGRPRAGSWNNIFLNICFALSVDFCRLRGFVLRGFELSWLWWPKWYQDISISVHQ